MFIEYMQCGDLMGVINNFSQLPIPHATFYAAQIVLVMEYLHGKNLIYRDLKPENVLVNTNGYLKLTDFGFIKTVAKWERTYTFCGTPEYIAPEIIKNQGYSHAVDWYSLGIFLYEMIYGRPPFMSNDPYEIFKMIIDETLPLTKNFDKNAKSLINKLCKHDITKRYGNFVNGVKDIKKHAFFKDTEWQQLLGQRILAPHIPQKSAPKNDHFRSQAKIDEYNDNANFPPIKEERDKFINMF